MSHNVKITGVSMHDMHVLKRAVDELNREFNLSLQVKEGSHPSRQWRQSTTIPNTIAIITGKDFQYDITLTRDDSGHVGVETEALMIVPLREKFKVPNTVYDNSSEKMVNLNQAIYGRDEALGLRSAVGPFMQRYAAILCEDQAAMNGLSTSREVNRATGEISVVAYVN